MSRPDSFLEELGIRRDGYGDGRSRMSIAVEPRHLSPTRTVHGGVLYGLADSTMGSAVWTLLADGETCATISSAIEYLRPVREGVLVCEGEVVSRSRRTALTRAIIRDGAGRTVAQASAAFHIGVADEGRAGKGERRRAAH